MGLAAAAAHSDEKNQLLQEALVVPTTTINVGSSVFTPKTFVSCGIAPAAAEAF